MATPSAARSRVPRRSRASRHLLGASALVLVGAFLPWVSTALGNLSGVRGAGLWTMYTAVLGVAGALLRSPGLAALHAAVLAAVAVALPVWQVVHLVSRVGFAGWMPGPGLVMTFAGGVVAAFAARTLFLASRGARAER